MIVYVSKRAKYLTHFQDVTHRFAIDRTMNEWNISFVCVCWFNDPPRMWRWKQMMFIRI